MKVAAGIDMLHVPYTGANNANIIGDLLANRVQVYFPAYPATLAALPTGKVKLLGVFFDRASSTARSSDREGGAARPHHRAVVVRLHGTGRSACADRDAPAGGNPQGARGPRDVRKLEEVGIVPVGNPGGDGQPDAQTDELARLAKKVGIEPNWQHRTRSGRCRSAAHCQPRAMAHRTFASRRA